PILIANNVRINPQTCKNTAKTSKRNAHLLYRVSKGGARLLRCRIFRYLGLCSKNAALRPPRLRSCEKIENSGNSRSQVLDYQEIFFAFPRFFNFFTASDRLRG